MYRVIGIIFTIIFLYHTFSQDNSIVDIYRPDFSDGHPTYFDVSVRNMLQLGNPIRASTDAVAATIAGEMKKDSKMLGLLRRLGATSFNLSLNSVKLWSYNAKMILQHFGCLLTMDRPLNVSDKLN